MMAHSLPVKTLRLARPADVPRIQQIVNHFAAQGDMLSRTLDELYENVRDFFVCERDGEIVGCAALHLYWGDLAEIKSLAVVESAQGFGHGAELVRTAIEEARRLGMERVFALTFRPAFFERLSFLPIEKNQLPQKIWGECIRCPKFPDCNEQAMILDL